jgi:hypothetical protein
MPSARSHQGPTCAVWGIPGAEKFPLVAGQVICKIIGMSSVGAQEILVFLIGIVVLMVPVACIACFITACIRRTAVWWILSGVCALITVLSIIPVIFIGARAWKKGSDRAAAVMEEREAMEERQAMEEVSGTKEVTCKNNLVSLSIPQGWTDLTTQIGNEDASLSYGDMAAEQYVIVITETRQEIINVFGEEDPFEKMHGLLVPNLASSLENPVTQPVETLSHPGAINAVRTRIQGVTGGMNLTYVYYIFETRDHFHQLILWTISPDLETVVPTFEEVASSFATVE